MPDYDAKTIRAEEIDLSKASFAAPRRGPGIVWTHELLMTYLREFEENCKRLGQTPTKHRYTAWRTERSSPSARTYEKRYGKWSVARKLVADKNSKKIRSHFFGSDADHLLILRSFIRDCMASGVKTGCRNYDAWRSSQDRVVPDRKTYSVRFGSWKKAFALAKQISE